MTIWFFLWLSKLWSSHFVYLPDKASILVLLEPPSDAMPMVNDRHLTFLEDPKNIAWVATVGAVLALCAGLATFAIIRNEMTRVAKPYASK